MFKTFSSLMTTGAVALSCIVAAAAWAGPGGGPTGDGVAIHRDAGGARLSIVDPDRSGNPAGYFYKLFGATGDVIVTGDWDGDGVKTFGLFRDDGNGNGLWILDFTGNGSLTFQLFGSPTDIPVVGDWDPNSAGDELGVVRREPGNGWLNWILKDNTPGPGFSQTPFGAHTDDPVPGNWNGDANDGSEKGVVRPDGGALLWITEGTGGLDYLLFGASTDEPAQGEYTGDGNTDAGVRRGAAGIGFFILNTSPNEYVFLGTDTDTAFNPSEQGQP